MKTNTQHTAQFVALVADVIDSAIHDLKRNQIHQCLESLLSISHVLHSTLEIEQLCAPSVSGNTTYPNHSNQ